MDKAIQVSIILFIITIIINQLIGLSVTKYFVIGCILFIAYYTLYDQYKDIGIDMGLIDYGDDHIAHNGDKYHNKMYNDKRFIKSYESKKTKFPQITKILLDIHEYKRYNMSAYNEIAECLSQLITIIEIVEKDKHDKNLDCNHIYELALDKEHGTLNAMHSLIFSIPNNMTDKLMDNISKMKDTLDDIIKDILEKKCERIVKNRIPGPIPYTFYNNDEYTYDYY